jgi:demethylmenaquinone methyltransferase/2-methoxy-6-polyprenyl-1,4-benzoquinol methylase
VLSEHLVDFFDWVAPEYDDWADGLHRRVAARLAAFVDPAPGQHVLDVGCGTGLLTNLLAEKVGHEGTVVGIDISHGMLAEARRRKQPNVTLVSMTADRIVFRDSSFDMVTMSEVLTYLIDPFAGLNEAYRVLKPGGVLGVSAQRRSLATEAQDVFFSSLVALARRHHLQVPRLSAERANFGEPEMLPGILEVVGFKGVKTTEMVRGGRCPTAEGWMELMAAAGPLPYAMLTMLGPELREQFGRELEEDMQDLGEEAFTYHHAFMFATASK